MLRGRAFARPFAKRYGHLLSEGTENLRNSHTVDHFVSCYPSHDFVIDDEEAKRWFRNVDLPSTELYRLVAALGRIAMEETHEAVVMALSPANGGEADEEVEEESEAVDAADKQTAASNDSGGEASDDGGASAMDDGGAATRESDAAEKGRTERGAQSGTVSILHPK